MTIHELSPLDVIELGLLTNLPTAGSLEDYDQPERRIVQRYPLQVVAMATPLDEQMRPVGEAFPVLTRDISINGIGLVHSRPLDMKYVHLDLVGPNGHEMHVIVQVLRCNRFLCGNTQPNQPALDDNCTYYESGGRFVTPSH